MGCKSTFHKTMSMVDLGAPRDACPLLSQLFLFHAVFGKNYAKYWISATLGLALLLGNPGSTTAYIFFQ